MKKILLTITLFFLSLPIIGSEAARSVVVQKSLEAPPAILIKAVKAGATLKSMYQWVDWYNHKMPGFAQEPTGCLQKIAKNVQSMYSVYLFFDKANNHLEQLNAVVSSYNTPCVMSLAGLSAGSLIAYKGGATSQKVCLTAAGILAAPIVEQSLKNIINGKSVELAVPFVGGAIVGIALVKGELPQHLANTAQDAGLAVFDVAQKIDGYIDKAADHVAESITNGSKQVINGIVHVSQDPEVLKALITSTLK